VDYAGRLSAHLPLATRLLVLKADGSVLVHSDSLSYKPLNWMSPPCSSHGLGADPGLRKGGVEADLQRLLAEQVELLGEGTRLVRREYPTAIGPVDLLVTDAEGRHVAVEVKRRGGIDGVEQLPRSLELLGRDPRLAPVRGVFAAQEIAPQARTLAEDRGIVCLLLDYDAMRGLDERPDRLF